MSSESTLWMGDIEPWMNEETIMKAFNECKIKPTSIKMIKDKRSNTLRNYCFIKFEDMIEANKALIQLNGTKIPYSNCNFKLNWANQNTEGDINVYVGNLSQDIDDIELYNLFKSRYPSVHHASIKTDQGISKGYGFVHFSDKEDYDKCLKEMDGYIFHNNAIKVKERKKKNEEKIDGNEKNSNKNKKTKNLGIKNNKNISFILNNINNNNDKKITLYKRKNNNNVNNIDLNMKDNNYYYKINNNNYFIDKYNNSRNFNMAHLNINEIKSYYPKKRGDEDSPFIENEDSTFSSQEKDQDLSSSDSISNVHKKRKFSDNIELLESNDHSALNKKIQESVDKMFEQYKYVNTNNECKYIHIINIYFLFIVSKVFLYYTSNTSHFADSFVF
jgi:hypothetical protein